MPCPIFRARHLLCKKESTAFTRRLNLPAGGAGNPITQHFPFCEAEFRPPKFCLTAMLPAGARPSSPIEKKRRESTIGTLSSFGADDGTWTHMEYTTRPSNVRVCQFRHIRIMKFLAVGKHLGKCFPCCCPQHDLLYTIFRKCQGVFRIFLFFLKKTFFQQFFHLSETEPLLYGYDFFASA